MGFVFTGADLVFDDVGLVFPSPLREGKFSFDPPKAGKLPAPPSAGKFSFDILKLFRPEILSGNFLKTGAAVELDDPAREGNSE